MFGRNDRRTLENNNRILEAVFAKLTVMQKELERTSMNVNDLVLERSAPKAATNAEATVDSPFLNSDGLLSVKELLSKRKGEGKKTDAGTH